jgi:hypothetical protein
MFCRERSLQVDQALRFNMLLLLCQCLAAAGQHAVWLCLPLAGCLTQLWRGHLPQYPDARDCRNMLGPIMHLPCTTELDAEL